MAKKTDYFEHESLQDKDSVINYLKALTRGIEKGEILISDEDETLLMSPNNLTLMTIKASKSKKEQSLRLKLKWKSQKEDDPDSAPLFIQASKSNK